MKRQDEERRDEKDRDKDERVVKQRCQAAQQAGRVVFRCHEGKVIERSNTRFLRVRMLALETEKVCMVLAFLFDGRFVRNLALNHIFLRSPHVS